VKGLAARGLEKRERERGGLGVSLVSVWIFVGSHLHIVTAAEAHFV
jgi:hypothetical protein